MQIKIPTISCPHLLSPPHPGENAVKEFPFWMILRCIFCLFFSNIVPCKRKFNKLQNLFMNDSGHTLTAVYHI